MISRTGLQVSEFRFRNRHLKVGFPNILAQVYNGMYPFNEALDVAINKIIYLSQLNNKKMPYISKWISANTIHINEIVTIDRVKF